MTEEQLEVFFEQLSPGEKVLFYASQARTLAFAAHLVGESAPEFPECFRGDDSERAIDAWRLHVAELIQICLEHREQIARIAAAIPDSLPELCKYLTEHYGNP